MGCCEVLVDLPQKHIEFNHQEVFYGTNAVYCSSSNPQYLSLIEKYGKDHVYTTLSDKDTIYNTSTDNAIYEEAVTIIQHYFNKENIKK